jgi:dATP pyrophosphohydrolase
VDYRFEIYARWRHRFARGVLHNHEHLFSLAIPARAAVRLSPDEHLNFSWLPWREAAAKCFSWSNRDAILMLGERALIA